MTYEISAEAEQIFNKNHLKWLFTSNTTKLKKKVDVPGIEPGTPPSHEMLREYYTPKPYARVVLVK